MVPGVWQGLGALGHACLRLLSSCHIAADFVYRVVGALTLVKHGSNDLSNCGEFGRGADAAQAAVAGELIGIIPLIVENRCPAFDDLGCYIGGDQ